MTKHLKIEGVYVISGMDNPWLGSVRQWIGVLASRWYLHSRNIGLAGAAYANYVYCIVLLINFYAAYRLGLKAFTVVLADLGPLLIVLFLVVLVLYGNPTLEVRLSINIIVMAVISWMALSGRRAQLFLNAVRRH